MNRKTLGVLLLLALTCPLASAQRARRSTPPLADLADQYVVDLVGTAASGVDQNRAGDVVGTSYPDPGCGSFCLPPLETVVWRGSERIVLPSVPGLSGITVRSINDAGWVVGFAGHMWTTTHAVLWRPVGGVYQALDLGTLPGTTVSEAIGVDELGRVVGWSTTLNFPPSGSPFLWSEATGMVDLVLQGFPDEKPLAISPNGTVATTDHWYRLGDPASVTAVAAPPAGFALESGPCAINDAGDQARFLVRVSGQNLVYLHRYRHAGTWQLLSSSPTGHLSRYGVGSINAALDVTATVTGAGVIARGPTGLAEPLAPKLSPAWAFPDVASTAVTFAGPMNARGEILAEVLLGRSPRLVRLVPAKPCFGSCVQVDTLAMDARFVPDPSAPGQCSPDLDAHDLVLVTLRVTTPDGMPVSGATVSGRILDDYWTNRPLAEATDADGFATFVYTGPCGVGAIAFLVDGVQRGGITLDETRGQLVVWQIPD